MKFIQNLYKTKIHFIFQRLTCLISLLFTTLLASAVFYKGAEDIYVDPFAEYNASPSFDFVIFKVTVEQLKVFPPVSIEFFNTRHRINSLYSRPGKYFDS